MIIITLVLLIFITNSEAENNDNGKPQTALDLDFNSPPLKHLNLTINFFEKPMIKERLQELMNLFLNNKPLFDDDDELEESWRLYIFDQIHKSIEISESLKSDVLLLSHSLIQELIEFLQKIFINIENDDKFLYPSLNDYYEKIEWKKNGKIDEVKTYLKLYFGRASTKKKVNDKYMFLEACKYCLEERITMTWLELPITTQQHIVNNVLNGKYYDVPDSVLSHQELETRHLVFYWRWKMGTFGSTVLRLKYSQSMKNDFQVLAAVSEEPLAESIENLNIAGGVHHLSIIPAENVYDYNANDDFDLKSIIRHTIPMSIEKTNVVAVQHLIDNYLKNENLIQDIVKREVTNWLSERKEKQSIYYDDMLLFLMRQMENSAWKIFYGKYKLEILDTMIESWPGKYLFLNIFASNYDIMTSQIYRSLFAHILQVVSKEYDLLGKKSLTSFWLLSEFLQKYNHFLKDEAILEAWSLPVLKKRTKLIAIAFIASIPNIKKSNLSKYQTTIDTSFSKFGNSFLLNKQYDVLSDYLNYMLQSNETKIEFIKNLDIDRTYINLLEYTDDSELSQLFDFYDWQNATGQSTLITKIINDTLSSNIILRERHDTVYLTYTLQV